MHAPDAVEPSIRRLVTTDGDELIAGAAGIDGQLVRTGRGDGTAALTAFDYGRVHLAVAEVGFPVAGEGVNPDDCVSFFTVLRSRPWTNSEGVTLSAGDTVIYPPGSLRHARDPAGVRTAGTVVPLSEFEAASTALGIDPDLGTRPRVVRYGPLWRTLALLADAPVAAAEVVELGRHLHPEALLAQAAQTTIRPTSEPAAGRPRRDDGDIVRAVGAFLDHRSAGLVPMLTLCRGVGVSERRLQLAFKHRLGISPNAFMRHRALQAAHRHLRETDDSRTTVTRVAHDAGFGHLGRFSAYYRDVFGESPSRTLRRPPTADRR